MATDKYEMVLKVHTTPSNDYDSKGLEHLVKKIPKSKRKQVVVNKGYKSATNDQMLNGKGSKSSIMQKTYCKKPLTHWQTKYNKDINKTHRVVERTFGILKRWLGVGNPI